MDKNRMCPNYSSKEWKRLLALTNGDTNAAHKVYLAHGETIPALPSISELKKELGFQAHGVSELKKNLIQKRIGIYNAKHGTAHRLTKVAESPTSWGLTLHVNIMPKYDNYKLTEATTKEVNKPEEGVVVEVTQAPEDIIHIRSGNEYIVDGEIYPTYEDAMNSLYHQLKTTKKGKRPISKLDKFLTDYLAKFGITVQQITDFKERYGINGVAVADMVNKIVAVSQGKADITTLPEEASHFIIEMLGKEHPLYKAMMKNITETKEYAQVKEEYKDVYTNEEDFQKEAAGKILANHIIKAYEGNKQSILDRIITWFKNAFKSLDKKAIEDQIQATYSAVAQGVISDNLKLSINNINTTQNLFQTDKDLAKLKKTLKKNIRDFENRAKVLQRKLESNESSAEVQNMLMAVGILKDRLAKENIKETIAGIIENIYVYGLPSLKEQSENYLKGDKTEMSYSSNIKNMMDSTKLFRTILNDLSETLNNFIDQEDLLDYEITTKEGLIKLRDIKNQMEVDLNQLDRTANMAYKERIRDIINEVAITYIGPDGKETRVDVDELLESKVGNIGWVGANVMPLHSVNDEILKIVYKIVNDIYLESHDEAFKVGQKLDLLQRDMEKAGFKDMSIFHEKDAQGNKTGFLISRQNWGAYHKAKAETKARIAKAFGVNDFSEINIDNMTPTQKKVWEKEWRDFGNTYNIYDPKTKESIPNPPVNPKFDELIKHPTVKAYYKELLNYHMAAKSKLPKMYNEDTKIMMLPQMRADDMQALAAGDTLGKKLQNLKTNVKEKFNIVSDDVEYGDQSSSIYFDVDGNRQKMLPIYFTRKLEDTNRLSNNITGMYAHFTEMAYNFNGLAKRLDDLSLIQKALYERTTYKNKKAQQTGDLMTKGTSNEYKAFENFIKIHVFGEQRAEVKIPIGKGKSINATKGVYKALEYIRATNLFMQVFTILSGGMKANVDAFVDARTGLYITDESQRWATGELTKNMPAILASLKDKVKTNKALVLMNQSGAGNDLKKIYERLDLNNPLERVTLNDVVYGAYEPFSFQVKGMYALAVYDNYRLVNGKFINKVEFSNLAENKGKSASDVTKAWKSYEDKTLYKAMEVKDGILVPTEEYKKYVTKELQLKVKGIVSSRTNLIEGNMDKFDKGNWSTNIFGNLVMLHRSWLVQGSVERFKAAGVSYKSGMYEEGFYLTVGKYLLGALMHRKNKIPLSTFAYKNLNQHEQRAIKRFTADASMAMLAYAAFLIVHAALDDEDDYWAKFISYLSSRFYLEQNAFFGVNEILNMLNSPSAATNFIDNIQSFAVNVFDNEEIKYGVYKGDTKRERALWKMSLMKNLIEMQDPEAKDKYVKNQIISGGILETFLEE